MFKKIVVKVVLVDCGRNSAGELVHEISVVDPMHVPGEVALAKTWKTFDSSKLASQLKEQLQIELDALLNTDIDRDHDHSLYRAALLTF